MLSAYFFQGSDIRRMIGIYLNLIPLGDNSFNPFFSKYGSDTPTPGLFVSGSLAF
jgi:hypothetical protein